MAPSSSSFEDSSESSQQPPTRPSGQLEKIYRHRNQQIDLNRPYPYHRQHQKPHSQNHYQPHQNHQQLHQQWVYPPTTLLNDSKETTDESIIVPNDQANGPVVIVRGEEIGIVIVVLLLWVGAIILFFNRWGKIRMLEPYQPKFCETHRPSCPMADSLTHCPTYSKMHLSSELLGSPHFAKCNYHGVNSAANTSLMSVPGGGRPRQNSVFVTSPNASIHSSGCGGIGGSRKTRSAIDLSSLVLSEEFLENEGEEEESEEEDERGKLKRLTSN